MKNKKAIIAICVGLAVISSFFAYEAILFVIHDFNFDYSKIDRCLDSGGKWDYENKICIYEERPILEATDHSNSNQSFEQIDLSLNTAFKYARNYPPRFDSKVQREKTEKELKEVITKLETMLISAESDTELLFRLGKANTFAYNLDIPGSGEKTRKHFDKLFSVEKNHTEGHLHYGQHLSGKGDFDRAVKHLKIAADGGRDIALQMIGLTYLHMEKNDEAIVYLKRYQKLHPDAPQVNLLLDSLDPSTESKYKFTTKQN